MTLKSSECLSLVHQNDSGQQEAIIEISYDFDASLLQTNEQIKSRSTAYLSGLLEELSLTGGSKRTISFDLIEPFKEKYLHLDYHSPPQCELNSTIALKLTVHNYLPGAVYILHLPEHKPDSYIVTSKNNILLDFTKGGSIREVSVELFAIKTGLIKVPEVSIWLQGGNLSLTSQTCGSA